MSVEIISARTGNATARLIIERGNELSREFSVATDAVIGRESGCEVELTDMGVSRHHARLSWTDGQLLLTDLGSTNGTRVNGDRIPEAVFLSDGDVIVVGLTELRYRVEEFDAPPPFAARSTVPPLDTIRVDLHGVVPARRVLEDAERTNRELGHEHLGFLSAAHGVLPTSPPPRSSPPGYEAWDEVVERMPELWRTLQVRQALDNLPLLPATADALPDSHLLRASTIISIFAQSYYRIESGAPDGLPRAVEQPWNEISERLGRRAPHLSYIDLIIANWKLQDPFAADPMALANLRLLVPTVDNAEERVLYLAQVALLHRSTPLITACIHAQEAVVHDDPEGLKAQLVQISEGLTDMTFRSWMHIEHNPLSDTHLDPVMWAKTVAGFAVPFRDGVPGPGGAAAPIFHILDVFFGRYRYDTLLGKEMSHQREWFPRHWRDFLTALHQVSVRDYVDARGDRALAGIHAQASQAYAGESGYLARHRLKAYGFLDTGFKVGRSVTIGGFSGLFKDRTWDRADEELAIATAERVATFPQEPRFARITDVEPVVRGTQSEDWVHRVVLDVTGTGFRYQPGDRCAILPENEDGIVDRTLAALRATGAEPVLLTQEWRHHLQLRDGFEERTTLALRDLLRFGRIRPVQRAVAKALHAASLDVDLGRIIAARAEDQWELWDLLDLLVADGFDPRTLWRAHPGQREHICRTVPPESFRTYSISSVMEDADDLDGARSLTLTIGRLRYTTADTVVSRASDRAGTASHFLGLPPNRPDGAGRISVKLVHPARFGLPADPGTPIVMFAGGTGIAPFRGFVQRRASQLEPGPCWLVLSARTRHQLLYAEELAPMVGAGWLRLSTAFSRDPVRAVFDPVSAAFRFEPAPARRVDELITDDDMAASLWDLLRPVEDGGRGGVMYICGRTGFAASVHAAVAEVFERHLPGDDAQRKAGARAMIRRMVAENRLQQDIFTTYTGPAIAQTRTYDASEIVQHNDREAGLWTVISGRVYDVSEFAHLHPGGVKIIEGYAGMDSTIAYRRVLHDVKPEVDALLGMYEIGIVRRLDLGTAWGLAVGPNGLEHLTLSDLYRSWVRFLYTIVEMENALRNDYSVKDLPVTIGDDVTTFAPLRVQLLLEVHERFWMNYLKGSTGDMLHNLWAATSGLTSSDERHSWLRDAIGQILTSQSAGTVQRLTGEVVHRLQGAADRAPGPGDPVVAQLLAFCSLFESADTAFMAELKTTIARGVTTFEAYESATLQVGADELLAALRAVPELVEEYHFRILSGALQIMLARS